VLWYTSLLALFVLGRYLTFSHPMESRICFVASVSVAMQIASSADATSLEVAPGIPLALLS
jgi:hypothetical protein